MAQTSKPFQNTQKQFGDKRCHVKMQLWHTHVKRLHTRYPGHVVMCPGYLEGTVSKTERKLEKALLVAAKKAKTKNWQKAEAPTHNQWRERPTN